MFVFNTCQPPKSPKTAAVKGDIRNFFTSIAPKSSKSPGSASNVKDEDAGKRKKKAMVLVDSTDSESEGPIIKPPSSKKTKVEDKPKKEVVASATKLRTSSKIPETPLQPVDIGSVFGNKPIQRSKEIPEKRKRTVIEDHSDDDFEATLQQLDEAPVTKKSKVVEKSTNLKGKPDSPIKKEKIKSPAKEEKSKSSASPPPTKEKKTSKASAQVEVKRESDKKRKPSDPSITPKKSTPTKDAKHSEEKDKRVKTEHKELDSNSNKTSSTPKSNKKMKTETTIVKETPQKKSSKDDDDDPDVIDSPAFDALEKRKEKAENYRKFLASRRDGGAKNPGSKPVPEVITSPHAHVPEIENCVLLICLAIRRKTTTASLYFFVSFFLSPFYPTGSSGMSDGIDHCRYRRFGIPAP